MRREIDIIYKDHEHLESTDDNLTLWKYMNFPTFVNVLVTNTIWCNILDGLQNVNEYDLSK